MIGDCGIDLFIDEVRIARFYNSALLTPQMNRDVMPLGNLGVPASSAIRAVVFDAAATSPVFVMVVLQDV